MKASFGEKRHELNVSTYQMVILLLFNEADSLSYRDILSATGIPPADLKRSLQSLACVKVLPYFHNPGGHLYPESLGRVPCVPYYTRVTTMKEPCQRPSQSMSVVRCVLYWRQTCQQSGCVITKACRLNRLLSLSSARMHAESMALLGHCRARMCCERSP